MKAMYPRWCQDPAAVDESWQFFFQGFDLGLVRPGGGDAHRQIGIVRLTYAYRDLGHFLAHLDPLGEPRPIINRSTSASSASPTPTWTGRLTPTSSVCRRPPCAS